MVCNTSFTDLSDSWAKTEIAEADVAGLLQLFDSVEAKQHKRPDMNEDLRLGFASDDFAGTKWKNLMGTTRWLPRQTLADSVGVPRRADVLETGDIGGDKLSGLEFAGFSRQNTDFAALQTPVAGFRRKTSEFGGPGSTFHAGHEKRTFRSSPFSALFAPKTEW